MTAAAVKQPRPPTDPLREVLAEAIEDLAAAKKAVANNEAAVRKCWAAMHEAEAAMAKAERGITTARVDAAAVVAAIAVADADDVMSPPNTLSLARAAYADAVDTAENLKAARDQLRRALPVLQQDVRDCEGRIEAAISTIEAPAMAQVNAALHALIVQAEQLRRLVLDMGDAYSQRAIGWAGCDPVKEQVDFAGRIGTQYFDSDIDLMKGTWAKRRAMLWQDPYAVLPDLADLPASAPRPPAA